MVRRKSILVAAAVAALVAPLTAFAQAPTGSVTTSPLHQAPAMGMPVLLLLAAVLAGVAMYRLRRAAAGAIVGLGLVAAVTLLTGLGYAAVIIMNITISGADCTRQTINAFDPLGPPTDLISNCPNVIQIVDIQVSCEGPMSPDAPTNTTPFPSCEVGQTLANGDVCTLPQCL